MEKAKQLTTLFLIFCVLFSTHNFTVYEHTCLITGIQKNSLSANSDFCGVQSVSKKPFKTPTIKRATCCKIVLKEFKAKTLSSNFFKLNIEVIALSPSSTFTFSDKIPALSGIVFNTESVFDLSSTKIYLRNRQFLI